jgi:hypothetical protein
VGDLDRVAPDADRFGHGSVRPGDQPLPVNEWGDYPKCESIANE